MHFKKEKIVTWNGIKKLVYGGPKSARNILTNISPNPAQTQADPKSPARLTTLTHTCIGILNW